MPPYTPNVSQAQQKKMFVLEEQGKLKPGEAIGRARASHYSSLPKHVSQRAHGLRAAAKDRRNA